MLVVCGGQLCEKSKTPTLGPIKSAPTSVKTMGTASMKKSRTTRPKLGK